MLGNYYHMQERYEDSYLCYEQALYYCEDKVGIESDDYRYILDCYNTVKTLSKVRPLYIIVYDNNNKKLTERCVNSIAENCYAKSYELTIVKGNKEMRNIMNEKKHSYDIMIIDNSAVVLANTLFCLRFGLYRSNVGSVGPITNCQYSTQKIDRKDNIINECYNFSLHNNIPRIDSYEKKATLEGIGLIIKGEVLEKIDGICLDYHEGNMTEYYDICMQIMKRGYKNILCWSSYIYCSEEPFLIPNTVENKRQQQYNEEIFLNKWGFHPYYYSVVRKDIISLIEKNNINVLEVGCGIGSTLGRIKYLYPDATVKGIELQKEVAEIGAMNYDIVCGDIETIMLDYEDNYFDYIIFGDVLEHLRDPWRVLEKVRKYLKKDGRILTSIPNILNAEVIFNLLKGYFTYEDSGILDRTHLRFFTKKEIIKMFEQTGYVIENMPRKISVVSNTNNYPELFDKLFSIEGIAGRDEFDTFQYLVKAKRII